MKRPAFSYIARRCFASPTGLLRSTLHQPTPAEGLRSVGKDLDRAAPTLAKLVCSIGPVSEDAPTLSKIVSAGMNVMRINFSHATYEEADMRVTNLRNAEGMHRQNGSNFNLRSVMLDTKGPEIRTGNLLVGGENKIALTQGRELELTVDEQYKDSSTEERLFVTYKNLCNVVVVGTRILLDDGQVELVVESVGSDSAKCRVMNNGRLKSRRGVNIPGIELPGLPTMTEKDMKDLKWGVENDVDFVAASFVRKGSDVQEIRAFLQSTYNNLGQPHGPKHPLPMIISKVENLESLDNFDDILKESDGIMVARGDLGVEMPFSRVTAAQKHMIIASNTAGKPIIVATQMLETMQVNPRPTRAEVSDVTNAVYDGADAVMLSGESANGEYPVESVATMRSIVAAADASISSFGVRHPGGRRANFETGPIADLHYKEATARAACRAAVQMNAQAIIVVAETGKLAQLCSKYSHTMPVICCVGDSPSEMKVGRQLGLSRSIVPMCVAKTDFKSQPQEAVRLAKEMNLVAPGDLVVLLNTNGDLEQASLKVCINMTVAEVS